MQTVSSELEAVLTKFPTKPNILIYFRKSIGFRLLSYATHLELAVDCSTMEFMQVLRGFCALRGVPALMISTSDNGSQFVNPNVNCAK